VFGDGGKVFSGGDVEVLGQILTRSIVLDNADVLLELRHEHDGFDPVGIIVSVLSR